MLCEEKNTCSWRYPSLCTPDQACALLEHAPLSHDGFVFPNYSQIWLLMAIIRDTPDP